MKYAVLSMDIEDWYHLDYFRKMACPRSYSMLDGLEEYVKILDEYAVKSSFFVVGELIPSLGEKLKKLIEQGHDLGLHANRHIRPTSQSIPEFKKDLEEAKDIYREYLSQEPEGFRAPCFSMDRARLDIVSEAGFAYDSSRISFSLHPLYGMIDLTNYDPVCQAAFHKKEFFEFEVSTFPFLGSRIPVSGGGYIRILPWFVMRHFILSYLDSCEIYVLYIHPFELSLLPSPPFPEGTSPLTAFRFFYGRRTVAKKLRNLISTLLGLEFKILTYSELRKRLSNQKR
jgi:hypothetical protein